MRIKLIIIILILTLLISCEKENPSVDLNRVTFTNVLADTYPDYKLDSNIVNYNEIIGYDSSKHTFLIKNEAGERIRNVLYPVSPTPFAIAVEREIIYIANFIPGYSSRSCRDCITVEPYSYDNKYRINLGYPSENNSGTDPRNDNRIISKLNEDNKLIIIE